MTDISIFAYIDPVSGTIILQLLIAGFVGIVGFFRKTIWAVCGRFFSRKAPDVHTEK